MSQSLEAKLDQLEILYSEQDYTVQALNRTVAQQDRELLRLRRELEQLRAQLETLKTELPGSVDPAMEKPPHY